MIGTMSSHLQKLGAKLVFYLIACNLELTMAKEVELWITTIILNKWNKFQLKVIKKQLVCKTRLRKTTHQPEILWNKPLNDPECLNLTTKIATIIAEIKNKIHLIKLWIR